MVCVSIPGRKLGGHRSERSGCGEGCSEDPIHFPRLQNPQGSQIGRKADGERRERGRRRLKNFRSVFCIKRINLQKHFGKKKKKKKEMQRICGITTTSMHGIFQGVQFIFAFQY
ncbi:hypothetical protein CDAR_102411 [Caerostris darwini]|uniref:Uncharacterized protein n=1 Tax=Caerostris darwini TaxID=1538125 RepID=A0AAV4QIY4_9ARAC|nr:hypothetical protein CDAR_102411 [Caerostris darwini]